MTLLLVVAKAPVAGLAKTRLCPPATLEQAAGIAAAALLDTLDAALCAPASAVVVALTGDPRRAARGSELAGALARTTVIPQRGTDFGDRLANAHLDTALQFAGQPVLQIGMDTPQLSAPGPRAQLHDALASLDSGSSALLGPALDGGWWALGLADPQHAVALRGVPMSRPDTGARTRTALRARGLAVHLLAQLSDVDTAEDARAVAHAAPHGRFAAAVHAALGAPAEVGR
jgi:glycosyltransferase A (GT-A) superfamily protein (DUF2064 family)